MCIGVWPERVPVIGCQIHMDRSYRGLGAAMWVMGFWDMNLGSLEEQLVFSKP